MRAWSRECRWTYDAHREFGGENSDPKASGRGRDQIRRAEINHVLSFESRGKSRGWRTGHIVRCVIQPPWLVEESKACSGDVSRWYECVFWSRGGSRRWKRGPRHEASESESREANEREVYESVSPLPPARPRVHVHAASP